jgi:hypothetical protein
VLALTALAGCTAVDDFSKFNTAPADLGAADLAPRPDLSSLPRYLDSCDTNVGCDPGAGAPFGRPLQCLSELSGSTVPGNICTRACSAGGAACSDYGLESVCGFTMGAAMMGFCLPRCTFGGAPCGHNFLCCRMGVPVMPTEIGVCVPRCP